MTDQDPYRPPTQSSCKQRDRAHTSRSAWFRILRAAAAGAITGMAGSLITVIIIGHTVGQMDYEMSGLLALFFGTVGAVPAAVTGAIIGAAEGSAARTVRLLASAVFGGLCSGAIYSSIVVPLAIVPAVVVFWAGAVPVVSGLIAGAVGGLIGFGDRRAG